MNFYRDVLTKLPLFNSPLRVSSLDYLEPVTRAAVQGILADAMAQKTPLMVFETYRSQHRQQLLFQQGATQLDEVGCHSFGVACDLVKDIEGDPSWKGDFTFLGVLAKKHGLISGIDWGAPGKAHGFIDACHVQRISVQDQPKLFDATFYPDDTYNPYKTITV